MILWDLSLEQLEMKKIETEVPGAQIDIVEEIYLFSEEHPSELAAKIKCSEWTDKMNSLSERVFRYQGQYYRAIEAPYTFGQKIALELEEIKEIIIWKSMIKARRLNFRPIDGGKKNENKLETWENIEHDEY